MARLFFRSQFLGSLQTQYWTGTGLRQCSSVPGPRTDGQSVVIHQFTNVMILFLKPVLLSAWVHSLPSTVGGVAPAGPAIMAPSAAATNTNSA